MNLDLDRSTWRHVTLGDVVNNVNITVKDPAGVGIDRVVAMEHLDPGELKIQRWGDPADGTTFTRRVRPGQTLFGKRRAYQRKVAYAEFDAICSGDILTFEADPTQLLSAFLPLLVRSDDFYDHALGTSAGSLSPRTNWRDLSSFEFDLPPLDEQKRIADLMWALEGHRGGLSRQIDATTLAVERTMTEWWNTRPRQAISEIGRCVTGSTPSKARPAYWESPEVPFITPSEIAGDVASEPRQAVSTRGAATGRMLPENSVLVACIGGDMGKTAVLDRPAITNQQITAIVGLSADDAFLLQALLAHPRGRAATVARETTTIVRKLNKSDLMKVEVPWPLDRSEMHRMIRARQTAVVSIAVELSCLTGLAQMVSAGAFGRTA